MATEASPDAIPPSKIPMVNGCNSWFSGHIWSVISGQSGPGWFNRAIRLSICYIGSSTIEWATQRTGCRLEGSFDTSIEGDCLIADVDSLDPVLEGQPFHRPYPRQ